MIRSAYTPLWHLWIPLWKFTVDPGLLLDPLGGLQYTCSWFADTSGTYSIMVSLFGERIHGSPFPVAVYEPSPHAPMCSVKGDHLNCVTARTPSTFEMRYHDRGGRLSQAVDLDVFVEPVEASATSSPDSEELGSVLGGLWDIATHSPDSAVEVTDSSSVPTGAGKGERKRGGKSSRRGKRGSSSSKSGGSVVDGVADISLDDESAFVPDDDDGYGSSDDVLASFTNNTATRRRAFPIQVGSIPLVVRVSHSLDSDFVAQLQPNQRATVVEERIAQGGKYVRALLAFDEHQPARSRSTKAPTGDLLREDAAEPESPPKPPAPPTSPDNTSAAIKAHLLRGAPRDSAPSLLARREMNDLAHGDQSKKLGVQRLVGWATLRKNGKNLVTSRVRLDADVRRQAGLLWKLQTLNDRLQLALQTEAALLDPTGVGFAFGGVNPGQLHSKGQAVPVHKVAFSVDRVGRYLLHVRLRQQARPIPGSPFGLVVQPGPAHQSATRLMPISRPLCGEVGINPADGCSTILQAHDRVGNECIEGGAAIVIDCTDQQAQAQCTDQGNGTYLISWASRVRGAFDAKVMINGEQVQGPPVRIELTSTMPEVTKTQVTGAGLKTAVAGESAQVLIKFQDQFANACTPGPDYSVGLAIVDGKTKVKLNELTLHSDFTSVWRDAEAGEMEVTYTPSHASHCELHLWWARTGVPASAALEKAPADGDETTEKQQEEQKAQTRALERSPLPGSPFAINVVAGEPTAECSYVAGWSVTESKSRTGGKDSKSKSGENSKPQQAAADDSTSAGDTMSATTPLAGDTVSVRIHGVDRFENPAVLRESSLVAVVAAPNGELAPLNVHAQKGGGAQQQKDKGFGGGKTQFEVKYEAIQSGQHELQISLNGEQIRGSPIAFAVLPSAATPQQSELVAPDQADNLLVDLETPSTAILRTFDKFGNACVTGGLRVQGRCQLVKQGAADNTILMPNNHTVIIEDQEDGTYAVHVAVAMPCTVKLVVNMDKDLPGATGELPPCQMTFSRTSTDAPPPAPAPAPALAPSPAPASEREVTFAGNPPLGGVF